MDKAPEAFRTISEVAEDLDLPQHVLRFWETRFTQIKPLKRGGGRRYYRPEDVDLLRGIQHLLYGDGYTIKGVQKLLRENGVKHVVAAGRREPQAAKAKAPKPAPEPAVIAPSIVAQSVVIPPPPEPTPAPKPLNDGSLGGAPLFARQYAAPEIRNDPAPTFTPPPAAAPEPPAHASVEPADDAESRRIEVAAKLLARLKALRRDYDIRLQAAKNGRS